MDVDAENANWRGTPVEPAAPATAPTPAPGGVPPAAPVARPVDLSGVENFEDLMETLDQATDDVPADSYPAASMEVGGSTGSGGLPTKEDLSEFDEVDRASTRDPGVSVEGYVLTPDGQYFDPDSQETFHSLEAWKAQRRSSRHRVVRASATESKDPVHGGLEEPEERNPNYYGEDTEPKRGSISLDEAFTRPDRFVLHHIAAREKNSSRSWPATQTKRGTRTR